MKTANIRPRLLGHLVFFFIRLSLRDVVRERLVFIALYGVTKTVCTVSCSEGDQSSQIVTLLGVASFIRS